MSDERPTIDIWRDREIRLVMLPGSSDMLQDIMIGMGKRRSYMQESLERLINLAGRDDLTNREMSELLKISLFLAGRALEINAKRIRNKQDRTEMVILMISLLTAQIFDALNIEQRNIIINPSDTNDEIYEDMEYSHRGTC